MEDRELLELAAKAAGYKVRWHERWGCFVHSEKHNIDSPPAPAGERHVWVPLSDDGDALRLAVKMRFEIQCYPGMAGVVYDDGTPDGGYIQHNPEKGQSDGMAVRRAIVRAAAKMAIETQ